tara:strand:- start:79 stop:357 length:279 start_codon:yes stop_codon:yes gene_type:complete
MRKQSFRKAIALEYGSRAAPVITVNESGANAEAIIAEAKRQGVYIAEDAQLVELLGQLELNEEIPDNLYTAVAVILSWVYWLKGIQPTDQNN